MNRHTFNANSEMLGDQELFFWTVNHWKPDHLFMMGSQNGPNDKVARALDLVSRWGGQIHYRAYSEQEGHLWRNWSPRDYVMMLKSWNRPEIRYNVGNEPIPSQGEAQLVQAIVQASALPESKNWLQTLLERLSALLTKKAKTSEFRSQTLSMSAWYADLFRIAAQEGVKVSGPGFATAAYTRDQLEWFDDMWYAMIEYGAWLNVHTYGHALFPWHAAGRDPNDLLYPARVTRNLWPTKEQIFSNLDWNYLILREEQIVDRIRTLNKATPNVIITECFLDRMPNIEVQFKDLTAQIDAIAGQKIYGVPTLYRYWKYLFPYWTPQQALWEQMNWAEEVYPEWYKAFSWFTWSAHDASPNYWSSRYGWQHDRTLLEGWPDYRKTSTPPTPKPDPTEPNVSIQCRALIQRNYREEPKLDGKLLGTLEPGDIFWLSTNIRAEADTYVWAKIDVNGQEAWVALADGLYEEIGGEQLDLSDYVRKDELPNLIREFLQELVAD